MRESVANQWIGYVPVVARRLCRLAVLAMTINVGMATAQIAATPQPGEITLQGQVVDAAGRPVANAVVRLRGAGGEKVASTDADGRFRLADVESGTYSIQAERSEMRSDARRLVVTAAAKLPEIQITLEDAGTAMPFADEPNFRIAGVTDWTAVGGHGSDSTLRTSEALARETATLPAKSQSDSAGNNVLAAKSDGLEKMLKEAVARDPASFDANYKFGAFYLQAGRYKDAIPLLQAAYRANPLSYEAGYDLASAREGAGDLREAREQVQEMLARVDHADLHRLAGDLDEKMDEPLAAVRELEIATREDPSEQNYFAWGSELLLHRAVWQAQEIFRAGAAAFPRSSRMLTGLGSALFAGALYDEAASTLCEASDLDPANPEPYVFMGKVSMAAPGPLPCVGRKLMRFMQEQPRSAFATYLYAMSLQKSGGQTAAAEVEELLHRAVSLDPKCGDAWLQLGNLAAARRDYADAIPGYKKAIDADSQLSEAHYRLALAYDRAGNREKAQKEFQIHNDLEKKQAADVERQRREIKQFLIVEAAPPHSPPAQ